MKYICGILFCEYSHKLVLLLLLGKDEANWKSVCEFLSHLKSIELQNFHWNDSD